MQQVVPVSVKDWQLKLLLNEMADLQRMRDSWERDARFECDRARHGELSFMLASFQNSSLCPSWQRVMEEEESKSEDCLSLWSGEDCYPLPFCKFKNNLCAATSYVTSLLKHLFHFCIVCTTCITLGLTHACNHANMVSEQVHFPCESPLGFAVKAWIFCVLCTLFSH